MKGALRWGGSLIILGVLACRLDWGQVAACFARLNVSLWALAGLIYLASQMLSSFRWQLLSRVLGFRGSFGRFVGMYHIGMFFNLLLPTSVGGDVVRAWYLAGLRREGTGGQRTLAVLSVFIDRLNGLVLLVLLAGAGVLLSPVPLPTWVQATVAVAVAGLVGGLAFLLAGSYLFDGWMRRDPARPLNRYVAALGRILIATRLYLRHPGMLLIASLLSLAVQVLGIVMVWCVGLGLGLEVPLICYGVVVPLTALLTLLPISLNGMGLREAGFVVLMAPLGVATATAATLGFLQFLAAAACSLLGLGFYLFGQYPRYRPQTLEEIGDDRAVSGGSDQGRTGQSAPAA